MVILVALLTLSFGVAEETCIQGPESVGSGCFAGIEGAFPGFPEPFLGDTVISDVPG